MAFNVGGMNMCIVVLSILFPLLIANKMEIHIHVGTGGNGARSSRKQDFMLKIDLEVTRYLSYLDSKS